MSKPWSNRRLHLVGVGGIGMSGIAAVAKQLGASVSGSDRQASATTEWLEEIGITVTIGHSEDALPEAAELVYSTAITESNPERRRAVELGLKQLHRSDLLAELCALKRCIAVTGTHGKTTTSSMIVEILRSAGLSPSYLVGGKLSSTGVNAEWGEGDWIVVEADESDRSLLRLTPEIAVVTNAEVDHRETYGSALDLYKTLATFCSSSEAVVVGDQSELADLPNIASRVSEQQHQDIELQVPGKHNLENATLAVAATQLVGVDRSLAIESLKKFQGAGRRFEYIGKGPNESDLYDDYAHHPTEVQVTLEAAKSLNYRRVIAIFQPHLYSRTQAFTSQFGVALAQADVVAVCDIYAARENASDYPGVSGKDIATAASAARYGLPVVWLPTFEQLTDYFASELTEGDLCITLGAGNIREVAESLRVSD